jgi:hypothetical protein
MRGNVCSSMLLVLFWAPTALAQQPVPAIAPPVMREDTPRVETTVHIDAAPGEIILESEVQPGDGWSKVCESPCDTPLPASGLYRVEGFGMKTSDAFTLAARGGRENIHVHAADEVGRTLGIIATTTGGAIPLAALLYFAAPIFLPIDSQPITQDETHALEGSLVASGVLLVTGFVLLVTHTNTRTTVSQDPSPAWWLLTPPAVAPGNPATDGVRSGLAPSAGTWLRLGGVF